MLDSRPTLTNPTPNNSPLVLVPPDSQSDVIYKLMTLIKNNDGDLQKIIQNSPLKEALNFNTMKENDAIKLSNLSVSDPKNEVLLKALVVSLNTYLTSNQPENRNVEIILRNPNIENALNRLRDTSQKENLDTQKDKPAVNRAFLMGANRNKINVLLENKTSMDSVLSNKIQNLKLLPKEELNADNIQEQGLIALRVIRNAKETVDPTSISKEWQQETTNLIKPLDKETQHIDFTQEIFDAAFKQALEQYRKASDLFAEQSQDNEEPAPAAPPDPHTGIPVPFGDIGAHDLSAPHADPDVKAHHVTIWDKLSDCGLNLIEVMLNVMLGDGTFPGIYKLNLEKMQKEENQLEAYLQYIDNLRRCYGEVSGWNAAHATGPASTQKMTFTEKYYDPTTGKLTCSTIARSPGDFLLNARSPDNNKPAEVDLEYPGSSGQWSQIQPRDSEEIQNAIQQFSSKQGQVQTDLSTDQQTTNSNLETAKNIISQVADVEKNSAPKAL